MKKWMLYLMLVFCIGCQAEQITMEGKNKDPHSQIASSLMVEADKSRDGLSGIPVDPATLKPISDKIKLDLGHHYDYAVSPGGKEIAAFIWPTGKDNEDGRLYFIDRTTWKEDIQQKIKVDERAGQLTYHPDGASLFWTAPAERDRKNGGSPAFSLARYMIKDKKEEEVLRLPDFFTPYES